MRQTMLPLLFDRHNLHRNMTQRRVQLELIQHRPAQHVRQEYIQRNCRGMELPRQRKPQRALVRHNTLKAFVATQPQQNPRVVRIVLNNQQHRIALRKGVAVVFDMLIRPLARQHRQRMHGARNLRSPHRQRPGAVRTRIQHRQIQRERTALAMHAGQPDFATQQHRQLAADRQTQTRAAVFARRARIRLLERFED